MLGFAKKTIRIPAEQRLVTSERKRESKPKEHEHKHLLILAVQMPKSPKTRIVNPTPNERTVSLLLMTLRPPSGAYYPAAIVGRGIISEMISGALEVYISLLLVVN